MDGCSADERPKERSRPASLRSAFDRRRSSSGGSSRRRDERLTMIRDRIPFPPLQLTGFSLPFLCLESAVLVRVTCCLDP